MHGGTQIHTQHSGRLNHPGSEPTHAPASQPPVRSALTRRRDGRPAAGDSKTSADAGSERRAIQQPARPRSVTDDPSPTSNPPRILNHTRAAHAGACFLSRPVWPARTQTRRRPPMRQPRLGGAPLHRLLLGVVVGCYRIVRHLDGGGGGTDATRRRHQQ